MLKQRTEKKLIIAVFICVFVAMFVLTYLTPMLADDYSYSFSYADRTQRITCLKDIIESLKVHRISINGRMIPHFLAHLFLMIPKTVFDVFNAFNAILLLYLVFVFFRGNNRTVNILLLLTSVFLIWLYMPVFGQVFLWLDGSLNYSWAMTFELGMLLPFFLTYCEGWEGPRKNWQKALLVLEALMAGAYTESASCAVLFMTGLFLILIYSKNKKIPGYLLLTFIAGIIGFAFLMTAPSETGGRTSDFSLITIAHNIQRMVSAPQEVLLVVYCLLAALFALAITVKASKKVLISAVVLFLGSCVSIGVFAVAAYFPWRSLCSTTVFLLLACFILMKELSGKFKNLLPVLTAVTGTMFIFSFILGVGDVAVVYSEYLDRVDTIEAAVEAGESSVSVPLYDGNTKYCASNDLADLYEDASLWPNCDMEMYYGIEGISALPETQ